MLKNTQTHTYRRLYAHPNTNTSIHIYIQTVFNTKPYPDILTKTHTNTQAYVAKVFMLTNALTVAPNTKKTKHMHTREHAHTKKHTVSHTYTHRQKDRQTDRHKDIQTQSHSHNK